MNSNRHNILVICSDQHNPLMSGYRSHPYVKTPNLDRLAESGTYFTRAYCNHPLCTPSRMSFITGKYSHRIDSVTNGFPLGRDEMTWARRLDEAGIRSTMIGKMDFCGEYQDGGFTDFKIARIRDALPDLDYTCNPPRKKNPYAWRLKGARRVWRPVDRALAHSCPRTEKVIGSGSYEDENDDFIGNYDHDRIITDWAVDYLKEKGSEKDGKPWMLYVGMVYPHEPYTVPARFFDMYYPNTFELPADACFPNKKLHPALKHYQESVYDSWNITEEMLRRTISAYYGMVTCMDGMVGEILDELEVQGLAENTVIIYTSDHGETLGEHGLFFKDCAYEGSVGIPLIVKGPGIPAGKSIDFPVSLVDMYPTILDIAGLETEPDRPGRSWLPLLRGEYAGRADYAFSEYHGHFFLHDWYMLVRNGFKYIWYSNNEKPSLFDLNNDPHEMDDLSGDTAYEPVIKEFEGILRKILDPEEISLRSKQILGLIGENGEDYTETLTAEEVEQDE